MSVTVHEALKSIANQDPDMARCINGVGFSGHDSDFGHKLAESERLSPRQEWYAAKLVRKYRKQVAETYLVGVGLKGKAKANAVETFLWSLVWEYQDQEPKAPQRTVKAVIGKQSGKVKSFAIRFPYNAALVETVRAKVPYKTFDRSDPKDLKWQADAIRQNVAGILYLVDECGFVISDGAREILESLAEERKAA